MSLGFELQLTLVAVLTVISCKRPLDVDRMGGAPFDQIAVIAIHRSDEIGQRRHEAVGQ